MQDRVAGGVLNKMRPKPLWTRIYISILLQSNKIFFHFVHFIQTVNRNPKMTTKIFFILYPASSYAPEFWICLPMIWSFWRSKYPLKHWLVAIFGRSDHRDCNAMKKLFRQKSTLISRGLLQRQLCKRQLVCQKFNCWL